MLSLSSLYSNRSYKRNEKSSGWFLQVNILSRIGSGGEGTKEGYSSDFFFKQAMIIPLTFYIFFSAQYEKRQRRQLRQRYRQLLFGLSLLS